jgi:RHS repeat-associated protein
MLWDEQNVLLETNTSNVVQARYTDYPGYWGGLASQSRSSVSSYYGFDSQGSTRILVSSAGVITDSYAYKVFGEEIQSGSGTVNAYWYVGLYGYYRANVGYVRARITFYVVGRWISRDRLGFAGGDWNLFEYVGNIPGLYVDPSGELSLDPSCKSCGSCGEARAVFLQGALDKVNKGLPTITGDQWKEIIECGKEKYFALNPGQRPQPPDNIWKLHDKIGDPGGSDSQNMLACMKKYAGAGSDQQPLLCRDRSSGQGNPCGGKHPPGNVDRL